MTMNINEHLGLVRDLMDETLYNSASAERTLKDWSKNKSHFYERFGNKTIIQTEEIPLDIADEREVREGYFNFKIKAREFMDTRYKRDLMVQFIEQAVGRNGFKNNKVLMDWTSKNTEIRHNKGYTYDTEFKPQLKINEGMKFSRSLRNFFDLGGEDKEQQEEKLKELQDFYSTYRQNFSSKSKGKLFLSINPLDYLTISDNNHNWSSCHNMYNGEYRMGNFNYMADGVTLVAYYASDDKFDEELDVLPTATWNSKRWRVLVHLQEIDGKLNVIYNKQYPFNSPRLIKELDNLITTVYADCKPSEFMEYGDERLNRKRLYSTGDGMCAYLDIGRQNDCFARVANAYLENDFEDRMTIGKAVYCVQCGNNITYRGETGECDECCDEWYCEDCDGHYYGEDMVWLDDESRYVCYDCYDNFHQECPECNEPTGNENLIYNEFLERSMCPNCWEDIAKTEGTLIFTLNNSQNQIFEGIHTKKESKVFYEEIYKEEKEIRDKHIMNGRTTWVTGIIHRLDTDQRDGRNFHSYEQHRIAGRNATRVVGSSSYWGSAFKQVERQANQLPLLKDVIILGSILQKQLDLYLGELSTSLESLGMLEEVNIDYSKVRVI